MSLHNSFQKLLFKVCIIYTKPFLVDPSKMMNYTNDNDLSLKYRLLQANVSFGNLTADLSIVTI